MLEFLALFACLFPNYPAFLKIKLFVNIYIYILKKLFLKCLGYWVRYPMCLHYTIMFTLFILSIILKLLNVKHDDYSNLPR